MTNGNYQYELTQTLSFVRYGGTEEELKAAKMILAEIEKMELERQKQQKA